MNRSVTPHDSVALFLAQKRAEGLSVNTLVSYERSLRMFLDTPGLPADVGEIGPRDAITWTATLTDPGRGLKPGAVNAYQRPVWVWFRWLFDNGDVPIDIPRRVRRVKVTDPKRRTATQEERERLVTVALHQHEHPNRNAAIVEVLWATGIRRAELAALQLEDYDSEAGTLFVRWGKGGKPRLVGIDASARHAIERYIVRDRKRTPGPLFLGRKALPMTANAVRCVLRSLSERAKVDVSAHQFRRACAARLRREGMDLGHVMNHLGHNSPTMTLIYSKEGETEAAIAAYHKLDAGVRPLRKSG